MPYEKVQDCTNHTRDENNLPVAGDQRLGIVSWSHGPTPADDYTAPDGWVQLMTKDTAEPARFEAEPEETLQRVTELLKDFRYVTDSSKDALSHGLLEQLATHLAPHLRHAFGEPVGGFAITLDRNGINRLIRLLQRVRGLAYGADA